MPGAVQRNFGELARALTNNVPLDAGEARRRINVAYVNEAMCHPWSHRLRRFTLQTEASYNTGTLLLTPGSADVTLTGGTWVIGWSTSPSSRRIAIQGRYETYGITITGANTGTLDAPWIGDALPAATYTMWRDTYPLPADCGFAKLMALYDPEQGFRLVFNNQATFLRYLSIDPRAVNFPERIMMVGASTENPPRPMFQMWPAAGTVRAYHGWYFSRPDWMVADADYPDWPMEFQDMLPLSATIEHYSTVRFNSPKYLAQFRPMYADLYRRMVKEMDGNSAIDVQIEDVFGRGRRSNAHWNGGNLLANVGVHMTNS